MRLPRLFTLLLAIVPACAYGQQELADTAMLHIPAHILPDSIAPSSSIAPGGMLPERYTGGHTFLYVPETIKPVRISVPDFSFRPGVATIAHWTGGNLSASGGRQSLPGLMQIESGAVGVNQSFGRLSVHIGAIARKYGYFMGLTTQYGIDMDATYRLSPRLSLSAFGTYYFGRPPLMHNGMPMPPSMMGYYGYTTFGATVDYRINDLFGVEAGAQFVQPTGMRRLQAEPIATPYIMLGEKKKVRIGLPVGQILYHLLKK